MVRYLANVFFTQKANNMGVNIFVIICVKIFFESFIIIRPTLQVPFWFSCTINYVLSQRNCPFYQPFRAHKITCGLQSNSILMKNKSASGLFHLFIVYQKILYKYLYCITADVPAGLSPPLLCMFCSKYVSRPIYSQTQPLDPMATTPSLFYFDGRGRAEIIRLTLTALGIKVSCLHCRSFGFRFFHRGL